MPKFDVTIKEVHEVVQTIVVEAESEEAIKELDLSVLLEDARESGDYDEVCDVTDYYLRDVEERVKV